MVEQEHFVRIFKIDKRAFGLSMVVALITVIEDPIIGILVGTAISLLIYIEKLTKGQFELIMNDTQKVIGRMHGEKLEEISEKTNTLVYAINGHLDYINGQAHVTRFEQKLSQYNNVILRMREVYFVDMDGLEVLDEIVSILEEKGKKVLITGVNKLIEPMMMESHAYTRLKKKNLVFDKIADALNALGYQV